MDLVAKLTTKGQMTIPAAVRERLGLQPGDRLRFVEGPDGRFSIERRPAASLQGLRGMVKLDRPVTGAEIDACARAAREGGRLTESE